jgi:GWxTD domain-containing protein
MKKCFVLLLLISVFSSSFAEKTSLRAFFSHASFYTPEYGPYLETYLSILGRSVEFVKNENGKFHGTVMVTMLFKQNDSIKQFMKYDLNTAEVEDTAHIDFVVFDQQRIALPDGEYDLELQIADKNRELPPFKATDVISINFKTDKIVFSDIELVESFTQATETSKMAKSGFDFIPYQDNFYPQNINKITFYTEIYNASTALGTENQFVVASSIQSIETGKPIDNYFRIKRETADKVNVIFSEFDISELPSGNFNLVLSLRDKENKEIASQRVFIQRSNPGVKYNTNSLQNVIIANSFVSQFSNPDTLREFIRMSFPIASANEKLFIRHNLPASDLLTMQQFFYNFWSQRSQVDPEGAWNKYYEIILAVESEFGSVNKKGYETERGRVYLQYGPPNQRNIEPINPWTFPYEIWHYYTACEQSNLKFVFYTRDRALNDYMLAHSNALGEVKNVNWQYEIKRLSGPNDTDGELYKKAYDEGMYGEHTGDYYNLKR